MLLITPEGMSARAAIDMSWELPDGPLLNIAPMQNHSIVILGFCIGAMLRTARSNYLICGAFSWQTGIHHELPRRRM